VPLENLEIFERMRVTSFIISSMLTALMTLLATLSSIFRSRAALELENLALRHQIRCASENGCKTPEIDLG
jgi:regulator of replication initiation timing